tara:strand:+ start:109 stop:348 length:240 start_codon:yes stop_codon:yes gene_type:complete
MREQLLKTALLQFQAAHAKAQSNLEIYLRSAAGIGEHPDVVAEIVTLVNAITEAEEGKKYIREKLNNEYDNRKRIQRTD